MVKKKCFYCDEEYSMVWEDITATRKVGRYKFSDTTVKANGIDRIDNDKEYSKGNVITCCTDCNMMRGSLTQAQFFIRLKKINMKLTKKK